MAKRTRRKRIYRLLRTEGISKKKAAAAAKRLARNPTAKPRFSTLAALGNKAKSLDLHSAKLRRSNAH
jgi:hypothetical protein